MKSLDYCCELDRELSSWRNRLHEVSEKFDYEPSINKFKLQPHIEGIHILEAELDDRLDEVRLADDYVCVVWDRDGDGLKFHAP